MYETNIKPNSISGLANGIQQCAEVVGSTMGSKGRNVIIEEEFYPYHRISNDGATIIDKMLFNDPLEKIGHSMLKEATERSNKNAGDGSSTTTVLLNAILQEGIKSQISPMDIKDSLDELLPIIIQKIDEQKKIITEEEVEQVATIAGESKELGKTLKEIYKVIGKDGIITLENSGTYETSYHITDGGVRLTDTGFVSDSFVHDAVATKANRKASRAIYFNPSILVTKRKIQKLDEIFPLMDRLQEDGKKDLVIFTDDMDSAVASTLVNVHKSGAFNILIIKAPTIFKNYVFEDFARITGATILEDSTGVDFKNLKLSHLGTCAKLETDKEETTVSGIQDIGEHLAELKAKGDTDSLWRASYLTLKTAILRLGAKSEVEATYLLLKAEDAIRASQLALNDGVVVGGGVTLLNIARDLNEINTVGAQILAPALLSPLKHILANARISWDLIEKCGGEYGINTSTGELENFFESGIVDASLITKNAVKNALGIASILLTGSTVLTIPPKSAEQITAEVLQNKGMRI